MMNESAFEKDLIWNDDRTACFVPEDFSLARIWQIPPDPDYKGTGGIIDVYLKNGKKIRFACLPDIEKAKSRLRELVKEIGGKRDR